MGVVSGVLNISSNAVSVLKSVRQEQSAFRQDVDKTRQSMTKTWGKKWEAKVETSSAAQKAKALQNAIKPLRKKVVTAVALKDAASNKIRAVSAKVKAVGRIVAKPLVKIKDATSAGLAKIKSGLKSIGKAVAIPVAIAGAALLIGAISQGAKLEQSIGGVETLYKDNAGIVQANADRAFQTAGLSANEYMESVTSFSASLLNSMGGDTAAAAAKADMAIIDMADNANKFGTDMESIQNAYQGFAKQNYTMLDNLKLGYGGTKEEMSRLLKDASALTGVKYDINNLSDVYSAVHAIQENLGVTGTTAKEASETFSGSFASMKAAASNLMGNLAIGGDVTGSMENLVDSASTFLFDNAIPMVGRIVSALPGAIMAGVSKAGPKIMAAGGGIIQSIKAGMMGMLPSSMGEQIVGPLFDSLEKCFTASTSILSEAMPAIGSAISAVMPIVSTALSTIGSLFVSAAPVVIGIVQIISSAISTLAPIVSTIVSGLSEKISSVTGFLSGKMGFLREAFGSAFSGIASVLSTAWSIIGPVLDVAISIFKLLFNVVQAVFPTIKAIISGVWEFLQPIFEKLGSALSKVSEGISWVADSVGSWFGGESEQPDDGEPVSSGMAPATSEVEQSATGAIPTGPTGTEDDPLVVDGDFDWPDPDPTGGPEWPTPGGYPSGGAQSLPPMPAGYPGGMEATALSTQPVEQNIDQSVSVQLASLAGSITIREEVDIDAVAERLVDKVVTAIQNTQAVPVPTG